MRLLARIAHGLLRSRHVLEEGRNEQSNASTAQREERVGDRPDVALARPSADSALDALQVALERNPEDAELHCKLGFASLRLGRTDDAVDCFTLALHYRPAMTDARLGLGNVLMQCSRLDEALDCYRTGLAHQPESSELRTNLGLVLFELGEVDEAVQQCEQATRTAPRLGEAWHNLGYVYLHLDRAQQALECFDQALKTGTAGPSTRACRGHALRDLGRVNDSIQVYDDVLRGHPGFEDAINNRAFAHLQLGQYAAGWRDYAWRFGPPGPPPRGFPYTPWQGESLAGRSILVYAEQGIGDEIMFASCLPDVVRVASRCIIECDARLTSLYSRAFPSAVIHGGRKSDSHDWLRHLGTIDFQAPIGDLPRFLRVRRESFPVRASYLAADPNGIARWRARFRELGPGPYIGVCWRGGTLRTRARARSVSLALLAAGLAAAPGRLISLQRGVLVEEEHTALKSLGMYHTEQKVLDDIDESSALITALDCVISVDATPVHLAGALGRPVYALLHYCPEWRYGIEGSRMTWYPTVTLLRQPAPSAWEPVVETLRKTLGAMAHTLATARKERAP